MIILRATNQDGVTQDLDVIQDIDILLDISAIESGDIGKVFGVSSQEFTLPGTDKNQDFFGFLDNLGATPAVGLTKTVDCQVLFNGQEIFTGRLYVSDIITDQQGDTIYNVVVVNETVDFKFQTQNLYLQDLDWSNYNHTLTYGNITGSWSGSLFNGDIAYPLINYGYEENSVSGFTQIAAGGGKRNFDNSDYPLNITYFKPTIRLKSVIDKIFDTTNYTYSSSFFDSADFQNIYLAATQDDKLGGSFVNPVSQSFQAYFQGIPQTVTDNIPTKVTFNTETFDNAGNYDGSSKFTADVDGDYTFYTQVRYAIAGATNQVPDVLAIELYKNGSPITGAVGVGKVTNTTAGTVFVGPITVTLQATDEIEVYVTRTYDTGVGGRTMTILGGTNRVTRFEGVGPSTLAGGAVDVGKIFDIETTAQQFLNGIIEKFNLVFEPITTERNVLRVEPFNTWVDQGQVVDWTDKVDRSVKFSVKHPLQEQPKKLLLADVEDKDIYNVEYTDRTGQQYGSYLYESDSDLALGERKIGSYFAATPMGSVPGAPEMILPVLAQKKDGNILTPYKYRPRLFYNLGLTDCSIALKGRNESAGTFDFGTYYLRDENGTTHALDQYLLFHHQNAAPAVFDTTQDLHFGTFNHTSFIQDNSSTKTKNSAYFTYWSFYVNELYDIDSRLLTCNVLLDPTELPTIRLNDKIFIDGQYYRINKIKGANILQEDSIEVELLKTLPRKNYFPRRRVVWFKGDPDYAEGYKDLILDWGDIVAGGTGGYKDYETGEIYTASQDLGRVAPKDGFTVYGSDVVWDNLKPLTATFNNQTILGNSRADTSADKIRVVGDNNTLGSSVLKADILGDTNDIQGLNEFISVSGNGNTLQKDTSQITVINGFENTIGSNSENVAVIGGYQNEIVSSSISNQLGGVSTDIKDSTKTITIGGLNTIVSASNETIVIGGNGETYTGFNGHNIFGATGLIPDDNFVGSDYRGGNIMWDTYLEGAVYTNRHDYEIVAYSGSVDAAYSGNGLFKYVYNISFDSLVSGSGTSFIELPTIQSQDQLGRTILFLAGNGVSSTNRIRIKSFGDIDPINGGTYYDLKAPDEFVELRATYKYNPLLGVYDYVWVIQGQSDATNIGAEGTHASFAHTGSQTITDITQPLPVQLNTTYTSQGISLSGSSAVVFDHAGTYQLTYVVQVSNLSNAVQDAYFWVRYNGVDYANSNTVCSLLPRKNIGIPSTQLATVCFVGEAQNDGDYIEIYWGADSTSVSLFSEAAGVSPTRPATPSVIANIIHVG